MLNVIFLPESVSSWFGFFIMNNPYEPPKKESYQRDSDRWGERHRPPTTDWCDFFFVMFILLLALFSPYLIDLVAALFKRVL
jgi:hypothetical protein